MPPSKPPIFIVGANRSGTTLLRLILNAHSNIAIPDELTYFDAHFASISCSNWKAPDISREQYKSFVRSFLERNREVLAPLSIDELAETILASPTPDLRRPYETALDAWASAHGKTRWGEKTPGNLFHVDVILDMFPSAQFIYLMRDPRAGVHSMNNTTLFPDDAAINALNRRKYMRQGKQFFEQIIPASQRFIARYEDLVAAPQDTTRRICRFLQETYEPQMLAFHENSERYMKKRAINQFNQSATKPISKSKIDAWQTGLTSSQIAVVEWICKREMRKYEYEKATYFPGPISMINIAIKAAYWKYQDWRHKHSPQYILQDPIFARTRRRVKKLFAQLFSAQNEEYTGT